MGVRPDGFLLGGTARLMATAAFLRGIGGVRPRSGPGGVVGRMDEMTGAARAGFRRGLAQEVANLGRGRAQIVFGVENIDLVSVAFLAEQGNRLAEERGAHRWRTIWLRLVDVMASQTGDISVGSTGPVDVEQGKRHGGYTANIRPRSWQRYADRVTASEQIGIGGNSCCSVAGQAHARDRVAFACRRLSVLVRQMAGGARSGFGNRFAGQILGSGKRMGQVVFVLSQTPLVRMAVKAE